MFDFIKKAQHTSRGKKIQLYENMNLPVNVDKKTIFNKNMNYYVCSFGGCGSTMLFKYLSNFGNVYHIHDRYPPDKLKYVGNLNTDKEVYSEWFNNVDIDENMVNNYKVIYIYRNPLKVIYSRFAGRYGPNTEHLKHIMCDNGGNIHLGDVLSRNKDLYKIECFIKNKNKIF